MTFKMGDTVQFLASKIHVNQPWWGVRAEIVGADIGRYRVRLLTRPNLPDNYTSFEVGTEHFANAVQLELWFEVPTSIEDIEKFLSEENVSE